VQRDNCRRNAVLYQLQSIYPLAAPFQIDQWIAIVELYSTAKTGVNRTINNIITNSVKKVVFFILFKTYFF